MGWGRHARTGRGRAPAAARGGLVTLASVLLLGAPGASAAAGASAALPPAGAAEAVSRAVENVENAGTLGALRAASVAPGVPEGYVFTEGAQRIAGAGSTADALRLEAGRAYRSTLPASGRIHYRLELDAGSNVYVSATAVPPGGGGAAVIDGVRVSVQDADGRSCDVDTATFGAAAGPHPVAASAVREISPRKSLCQDAGTYYVIVERADPDGKGASPDDWELELTTVSEPRLERAGVTTAPEEWDSASPRPVTGQAQRRAGGAGFAEATPLDEGVWRDDIRPGQTLFYQVPVDWGRQFHATAELGSASSDGTGFVPAALDLDLYNPVRGHVADVGIGYDGRQKTGSLPPLPHVAYANRHATGAQVGAMRFAGSYYLVAHLRAEVADDFGDGPVPLTLRVRISGAAQDGPEYAEESAPAGVFEVTAQDREAAARGRSTGDGTAMTALAVGGIGTGSALLVGLAVWTVAARRRNVSPDDPGIRSA
ncbi:hypothetical protein ABZ892_24835 [Streptomyces sp. NPDC046924]|uniref:hypothetical protein n=1 Tax=Streptomyces sp. NPDC046924 TaxID=3155136 RepID=UPI0033CC1B45